MSVASGVAGFVGILLSPFRSQDVGWLIDSKRSISLALVLPLALLAGFLLNFMPCVLPVVGLKVMSFVEQSGESRGRMLLLNLAYSAGLISFGEWELEQSSSIC